MHNESLTLEHHAFVLDAKVAHPLELERDEHMVRNMMEVLLERLHMKELSPLAIFPATDFRFPGFSFVQPITTSHIAGHYFDTVGDEMPHIHLDIYSCKLFDWRDAMSLLHSFLQLAEWDANYLVRHHGQDRICYQLSGKGAEPENIYLLTPQEVEGDKQILHKTGLLTV